MLKEDKIEQYKSLYLKHYGVALTDQQATEGLINLIEAVKLAMPIKNTLMSKFPVDSQEKRYG